MIEKTLKRLTAELEHIVSQGISIHRGLDLLEAVSESLEEILALNTLRESLEEIGEIKPSRISRMIPLTQSATPNLAFA